MSFPTARLTDITNHGAVIISASHNTFTNSLPIARITDLVACPLPGHGINPIVTSAPALFTNNLGQARVTDCHACGGIIVTGSPNRLIGNGSGGGVGEVAIGAMHQPDGTTIVYTRADDPDHETAYEVKAKKSGDSSAGVTVFPSGKPDVTEPSNVAPSEPIKKNGVGDQKVDSVTVGDTVDYSMKLSPNFTLGDLTTNTAISKKPVKAQHGLTVSDIITNLKALAVNCLEPLASTYGRSSMVITSGFRTGSSTSQHERGMAADVQFSGQHAGKIDNTEMYNRAVDLAGKIAFDQIILEYIGMKPWIHVSYNEGKNRKATLTAPKGGGYTSGLKAL